MASPKQRNVSIADPSSAEVRPSALPSHTLFCAGVILPDPRYLLLPPQPPWNPSEGKEKKSQPPENNMEATATNENAEEGEKGVGEKLSRLSFPPLVLPLNYEAMLQRPSYVFNPSVSSASSSLIRYEFSIRENLAPRAKEEGRKEEDETLGAPLFVIHVEDDSKRPMVGNSLQEVVSILHGRLHPKVGHTKTENKEIKENSEKNMENSEKNMENNEIKENKENKSNESQSVSLEIAMSVFGLFEPSIRNAIENLPGYRKAMAAVLPEEWKRRMEEEAKGEEGEKEENKKREERTKNEKGEAEVTIALHRTLLGEKRKTAKKERGGKRGKEMLGKKGTKGEWEKVEAGEKTKRVRKGKVSASSASCTLDTKVRPVNQFTEEVSKAVSSVSGHDGNSLDGKPNEDGVSFLGDVKENSASGLDFRRDTVELGSTQLSESKNVILRQPVNDAKSESLLKAKRIRTKPPASINKGVDRKPRKLAAKKGSDAILLNATKSEQTTLSLNDASPKTTKPIRKKTKRKQSFDTSINADPQSISENTNQKIVYCPKCRLLTPYCPITGKSHIPQQKIETTQSSLSWASKSSPRPSVLQLVENKELSPNKTTKGISLEEIPLLEVFGRKPDSQSGRRVKWRPGALEDITVTSVPKKEARGRKSQDLSLKKDSKAKFVPQMATLADSLAMFRSVSSAHTSEGKDSQEFSKKDTLISNVSFGNKEVKKRRTKKKGPSQAEDVKTNDLSTDTVSTTEHKEETKSQKETELDTVSTTAQTLPPPRLRPCVSKLTQQQARKELLRLKEEALRSSLLDTKTKVSSSSTADDPTSQTSQEGLNVSPAENTKPEASESERPEKENTHLTGTTASENDNTGVEKDSETVLPLEEGPETQNASLSTVSSLTPASSSFSSSLAQNISLTHKNKTLSPPHHNMPVAQWVRQTCERCLSLSHPKLRMDHFLSLLQTLALTEREKLSLGSAYNEHLGEMRRTGKTKTAISKLKVPKGKGKGGGREKESENKVDTDESVKEITTEAQNVDGEENFCSLKTDGTLEIEVNTTPLEGKTSTVHE